MMYSDKEIFDDIKSRNLDKDDYIIIDDLLNMNETYLDFSKHIYVRKLSRDNQYSNIGARLLLDYLRFQGHDVNLFINKYYKVHNLTKMDDYYEWLNFEDSHKIFGDSLKFLGVTDQRRLVPIGQIAMAEDQTINSFLEIMMKYVPLSMVYETAAIVNRNYNNDSCLRYLTKESIGKNKYKIIVIHKYFNNYIDIMPFRALFWIAGTLSGIPTRKGKYFADVNIKYCQLNIIKILQNNYSYMNYKINEDNNFLYINDKAYAKKVLLKEEKVKCNYSWITKIKSAVGHKLPRYREIYSSTGIDIQDLNKNELETLLKNKNAVIGYQIIEDLYDKHDDIILKAGEIYNIPYTCFDFIIDNKSKSLKKKFSSKNESLTVHLSKMKKQVVELENARNEAYTKARLLEKAKLELEGLNKNLEQKVKERTKELEIANEKIKEKEKQKTNFFINLTHETKTPLTLISNYLDKDIRNRGESNEIKIVKENINKLKRDMINYLDMEKLERGQDFYNHDKIIDLSNILKTKILMFQEIASKKNISIESNLKDFLYVKIDPSAMDRIINNLLDNAIKYSNEDGKIEIKLNTDDKNILFTVKDTGIGISEDQIKHIFNPSYQITHEKRNIQGIGMGLNIVKKIIDEIAGKIKVESKEKIGSCFKIILKRYKLKKNDICNNVKQKKLETDIINIKFQDEVYNKLNSSILVVEDNKQMLSYLQGELKHKHNVILALNGKKAIEKLKKIRRPNLIISDIMMDEMNGYELYEYLNNEIKYRSIPFIYLTAKTGEKNKLEGIKKGAVDYISKPFNIEELKAKIDSLIKIQDALRIEKLEEISGDLYDYLVNKGIEKKLNKIENNKKSKLEMIYNEYKISKKQIEIISLIKEGKEHKEIADILGIKVGTIITHITRIYSKCKINNKVELINLFSVK